MAYKIYTGNDWVNASFDPVNVPVANDVVVIPPEVTGNKTDTGNLANDVDLDLLMTHPGFTGDFGADGAPIKTAADLVVHQGGGGFFYQCTDNGAAGLTTDEVRIEAADNAVIAKLSTDATATDGIFTKIIVTRGNVTLDASIIFSTSTVRVAWMNNIDTDATLTIAAGAPTLAVLEQYGGTATPHNVVTDLRISRGICFKETAAATNIVLAGGTLVYNHDATGGEVVLCEVQAGATLDLMRNAVAKVLDKVVAYPGSTVLWDPEMHTITDFDDRRTGVA